MKPLDRDTGLIDEDACIESFERLDVYSGNAHDACWNRAISYDADLRHLRRVQKMYLARYARQSLLQWDEVEVVEIQEWCETLSEMMSKKGGDAEELLDTFGGEV